MYVQREFIKCPTGCGTASLPTAAAQRSMSPVAAQSTRLDVSAASVYGGIPKTLALMPGREATDRPAKEAGKEQKLLSSRSLYRRSAERVAQIKGVPSHL